MDKLKITLHPIFLIVLFALIYFGGLGHVIAYLVALSLHEYSHIFVAKKLGYAMTNLNVLPYGASLSTSAKTFSPSHEIAICLAGPGINLISMCVVVCVWWMFPSIFASTASFVQASASLALLNMLPIYPLDMGRVVAVLVDNHKNKKFILKVLKLNSYIFTLICLMLFIWSLFTVINPLFLILAIFMFISSFDYNKQIYYNLAYAFKSEGNYNKIYATKTFVVPKNIAVQKLLKLISADKFCYFVFVDECGEHLKTLSEKELIDGFYGNEEK